MDDPPLEVRVRLESLLQKGSGPIADGELLRAFRAVEVLEQAGGPEAQQLLGELARGAAGARLTQAARGSLERLVKASR